MNKGKIIVAGIGPGSEADITPRFWPLSKARMSS